MRILIAPDKFKDALDAPDAAEAMRLGALDARPDAEVELCPLADGGEGTGRLLAAAWHAEERITPVHDPLGRERQARWWRCADGNAIIEMAQASGLHLLQPFERNALHTSSYGTGDLIRAALESGANRITLCVGGSATVDGGAGCLQALGWRFFDEDRGRIFEPITGATLSRIRLLERPAWMPQVEITILTDVDNPLLGRGGAAPTFAPQKGADPTAVIALEANLRHWAHVLAESRGVLVHAMRGGGAAGGLPAGLVACLGARCESGFDAVARVLDLAVKMRRAALCITGEGRLDEQTAGGKVVAGVGRLARDVDTPVMAFVGQLRTAEGQSTADLAGSLGLREIVAITPPGTPLSRALEQTGANLRSAVAQHLAPAR